MSKALTSDLKLIGRYAYVFALLAVPVAVCWVEYQVFKLNRRKQ